MVLGHRGGQCRQSIVYPRTSGQAGAILMCVGDHQSACQCTVTTPASATFSVTASGMTPLTYQWQKNGVDIPGAMGSTYPTPPTTLADSGSQFRVRVSNSAGSAPAPRSGLWEPVRGPLLPPPYVPAREACSSKMRTWRLGLLMRPKRSASPRGPTGSADG